MSIRAVDTVGRSGMVASTQDLASRAGHEMLLAGGNAIDAAVATALALCVVQPSSNGIAGYGGAMVVYLRDERRVTTIDYNCRAPRAAREDMYELDESPGAVAGTEFPPVVGRANFFGPMAVSVPGTIAGLHLAEKTYGKLGWAKVVEPARKLAADGFTIYEGLSENIRGFADKTDSESARAILPDGHVPGIGETWVQADLARLLEVLAADPSSVYRGDVARRIVERVQSAGGILTEQDMAEYRCDFTQPLTMDYRGVGLHACTGLNGSICAFEVLAVMQKLSSKGYESADAKYWGDFAGALTLAWRDRLAYVGDVPGIDGKIMELISDAYASGLAEIVRSGKVTTGSGGADPLKETIHLTACDADRNMVSLTQTHGGGWGTRFGIPGLGIVIGHGMSRFDPRPGLPNSPGPCKAPLHNMSPLVLTDGVEPMATVGLPGGRMIPAVIAGLVMGIVDFGMGPAQTVSAPRIHTEGGPISYSDDVPQSGLDEIKARGHELKDPRAIGGNVSVIMLDGDRVIGSAQAGEGAALAV